MVLKLNVPDLPSEGLNLTLMVPRAEAQAELDKLDGEHLALASDVTGQLRIEPAGGRIVVRGDVGGLFQAGCSRCLEDMTLPVQERLLVLFLPEESLEEELELEEKDLNCEYFSGEEIDLLPVVLEHLVLGLPIKPLCGPECLGLCPRCGANLNLEPCACEPETGHPAWAALKNFKNKLPESH